MRIRFTMKNMKGMKEKILRIKKRNRRLRGTLKLNLLELRNLI
jgi:hypothetical protein